MENACEIVKTGIEPYVDKKPYYSTGSIKNETFTKEGDYEYNKRPSRANRIAKYGELIDAKMQGTIKVNIIDNRLKGALLSTGFYVLRKHISNLNYIKNVIYSQYFQNEKNKKCSGSTQKAITDKNLGMILIPLPPLEEQKRISKLLKVYIEKINFINKEIKGIKILCNFMKNKILDNIFNENSSYKSYYPTCSLIKVCNLLKGIKIDKGTLPYLEAKVIRGTKSAKQQANGIFIKRGDKVILVDGENSGEIMAAPYDGYMGSTFRIIEVNKKLIDDNYLSLFIFFNKKNLKNNKTGSAIPHLNKKIFNNLKILLPPINKQKEIVVNIRNIFKLLSTFS